MLVGGEIALLIHGGFQMFLRTPSGKEVPALATHLKTLHEFDDDLREGLGMTTLYNQALGTVCDDHLYDRVEDRDAGPQHHAWDKYVESATPPVRLKIVQTGEPVLRQIGAALDA